MKICFTCKIEKDFSEFTADPKSRDLLKCNCKSCTSIYNREYRSNHGDKKKEYDKEYYSKNKDKINGYQVDYYASNKEYINNRNNEYRKGHRKELNESQRVYAKKHKEEIRKGNTEYRQNNKERLNIKRIEYDRSRCRIDINYKLARGLRARMRIAVKHNNRAGSAVRDLGCSIEQFRAYIETKFHPNPETGELMTWKNWTVQGWHLDHIKPLVLFDLTNREEFLKAAHYTNLQPLWAKYNLKKSDKY